MFHLKMVKWDLYTIKLNSFLINSYFSNNCILKKPILNSYLVIIYFNYNNKNKYVFI